jgi:Cof subfamily protein (haloacid dehalogenase superfamily)
MSGTHAIKLIAVDIDGTLLSSKHELGTRTKEALQKAMAAGIKVMLATGKTFYSARDLYPTLGLTTPGVFNQGTIIHNPDGSIRHQQMLPVPILRRIIPFVESRGFCVIVYSGQRLLVRQEDPRADLTRYHEPRPEAIGALTNALGSVAFNKLIIVGNDAASARAMHWQLGKMVNGEVALTFAGIPNQFEVLPLGVSKGKAVMAAAKEMGIALSAVMGIGDADNDSDLISMAGLGIAMGNAPEHIRALARHVVASSDEDGVAEAIERYVLTQPSAPAAEPTPQGEASDA